MSLKSMRVTSLYNKVVINDSPSLSPSQTRIHRTYMLACTTTTYCLPFLFSPRRRGAATAAPCVYDSLNSVPEQSICLEFSYPKILKIDNLTFHIHKTNFIFWHLHIKCTSRGWFACPHAPPRVPRSEAPALWSRSLQLSMPHFCRCQLWGRAIWGLRQGTSYSFACLSIVAQMSNFLRH